jgi:hypothetical protein
MQYNAALGNAFTEKETWRFVNKHAAPQAPLLFSRIIILIKQARFYKRLKGFTIID